MGVSIGGSIYGGNPRNPGDIRFQNGHYRIAPYIEDGDANYKFHLLVEIRNSGDSPARVPLEIDWADERYIELRARMVLGSGTEWKVIRGRIDGAVVKASVTVPPGKTLLSLHPAFGYDEHQRLLRRAAAAGVKREVRGRSAAGADIDLLHFGRPSAKRPTILMLGRMHPYETAGSYCAEAIADFLMGGSAKARSILNRFNVAVIPTCNPDGVEAGLCKRVALDGPDLVDSLGSDELTAATIRRTMDDLRPVGLLDIHGWMHTDQDGIFIFDPPIATRFLKIFRGVKPDFGPARKWLEIDYTSAERSGPPELRGYCSRQLGAETMEVSFGWHRRTVEAMRELGRNALKAFADAIQYSQRGNGRGGVVGNVRCPGTR